MVREEALAGGPAYRLLMEFRDGQLTWSLPDDALAFMAFLRSHKTADSREEKKGSRYRLE